ncbi:MAG: hypothetical protein LBF83_04115 [Spirochaetaceae bacterium]|jgi:hypothetical protein|nr:hypothetical protein [Spirochaetaceae bacterium]
MKKFFFGMTVLLSASLVLIGCPTDSDTETVYVNKEVPAPGSFQPPADTVEASSDAALVAMLADTAGVYSNIAYEAAPGVDITVPATKTLYLGGVGGNITLTNKVVVNGRLVVFIGGDFTPGAFLSGGGTLVVEVGSLTVSDDTLFDGAKKLGGVTIQKAATLVTTAAVDDVTKVGAWVSRKGNGSVSLTVTTLTPSATLAAVGSPAALEYAGRTTPSVRVINNVAETATSLIVGPGVALSTSDDLDSVTTLTVNGTLSASAAAFAGAGVTVTLGGKASVVVGTIAKLAADIIVPAGARFSATAVTDADGKTVTYKKGSQDVISDIDLTFSKMGTDGWTLNDDIALAAGQSVIIPESAKIVVKAGKKITNAGTIVLEDTASLVLATASETVVAKIEGAGKLVAGATTITGAWGATAQTTTAGTVTILSAPEGATITADGTNATGLKAGGAGAVITQAAGDSNALTIAANTTINLAGDGTTAAGGITLISGTNPAKLAFAATSSKVLAGAGAGGTAIGGLNSLVIGGKTIVNGGLVAGDYLNATGKLVQLGGTTQGNFTASTTASQDVVINSTVAAAGSA